MPEQRFVGSIASRFDELWASSFDPAVVDPAVELLAALAGAGGSALELGVGTGRLALPLARRGVAVHGIELSPDMVAGLRAKPGGADVDVTIGDFATVSIGRRFDVVYLVRNTITNLTTQDEQVACFRNVAAHLLPGGAFVVENYVPALPLLPPGERHHPFDVSPTHLGIESYDDPVGQVAWSHHWWILDSGRVETFSSPHRYVWPSELDLMARLAGLELRDRWADWSGAPFTASSRSHVSVWRAPVRSAHPTGQE